MTATVIDLRERMSAANERTRRTVNALADYRGLHTDAELAGAMGMGRTKINNYRTGTTKPRAARWRSSMAMGSSSL